MVCVFNDNWLKHPNYKDWLCKHADKSKATCGVCKKDFDIARMGEAALRSHLQGKKHQINMENWIRGSNTPITGFLTNTRAPATATTTRGHETHEPAAQLRGTLHQYNTASRDQCTTAECLWAMKTCCSHYSYKSCDNIQPLFQKMFPDSQIAKSFSCGEKKCAYVMCHGLAPFFSQELLDQIKKQKEFVLLFDESLNLKTQSKQLDIFIRFFDEQKKEVVTRYFNSAFVGHATVADMITHFQKTTSVLNLRNMIQLSMDGPNVNWAFFRELEGQISADANDPRLINIGSCGLHIVHGAFKCGGEAVNWDLYSILSAIYTLFKDTPARREDFETITGSTVYAFKCCPTRWIENAPVARRAIEMLPHLTKFVETVRSDRKYTCPKTKSFEIVKDACQSVNTLPRLHF